VNAVLVTAAATAIGAGLATRALEQLVGSLQLHASCDLLCGIMQLMCDIQRGWKQQ
jgi:hypothetical protein